MFFILDAECSSAEFRCNDGTCISIEQKCDQIYDCDGNEDEDDCEGKITPVLKFLGESFPPKFQEKIKDGKQAIFW